MKPLPPVSPRVLLVDSSANGLLVRRTVLEDGGYRVETARGGDEALERFASSAFDVVVTGYAMPRMRGDALIAKIRAADPNARIVLLADPSAAFSLSEESTGANVVITKDSREASHLLRWVKRLANSFAQRKPVTSQRRAGGRLRAVGR
jgi:CheY-like chemotaxis protein